MSQYDWVSIVALCACLVLAASAYRARQIDTKKTLAMALAWGAIFLLVAAIFSAVGPR